MRIALLAVTLTCLLALPALAQHAGHEASPAPAVQPYAGQQARAVTSLTDADVKELLAGGGWGLAKPAEFNGYPGPAHVLELADKLALTPDQRRRVERSFKRMQQRAKSIGARYVSAEQALDSAFRSGKASGGVLKARLRDAERLRAGLRLAHLAAHMEITPVLTPGQRKTYAELRGYGAAGHHEHGQMKH